MMRIIYFVVLIVALGSCDTASIETSEGEEVEVDTLTPVEDLHGDGSILTSFNLIKDSLNLTYDSLYPPIIKKENFTQLDYTYKWTDYYDDTVYIKRHEWKMEDSTIIVVYWADHFEGKRTTEITLFNGRFYQTHHSYGPNFGRNSDIFFHYDTRQVYTDGENYLMVEQPASWNGLANQFDMYQLLQKFTRRNIVFCGPDSLIR